MNFKRSISKLLSFVMCFALLLSMGSFAFADGEEPCQHVYDEGVVTTEPSCTAAGVKTYTCTVDGCGDTYTEPVDLVDHSYAEGKCTVCGTDEPAGEPEPVPNSCTGDENCTADGDDVVHSGTCPKAAAAKDKPPVDTGIGCTGDVNCSADGDDIIHTGDCPKASAVIVEPPVCTCATKCSNDAPDANCQVCASSADLSADCVGCTGEKDCHAITHVSACLSLVCTCMKPCEGGGIDTDCPVCNDSTDISVDCKGQIPDPTYIDHGSGQLNGEDMQRIVEFKTVADKNGYRYEDWYAEFYLSFTGFVGTIDMGGSSLGGILHSFGDLTRVLSFPSGTNVSANQSVGIVNLLAVMEGLTVFENGIPWEMVCDGERFTCSIYVNPDILNKYPDFKVNLSLVLKAPDLSSTIYLENIDYDVPALLGITDPVARIDNAAGGSYYETLEDAIADSTNGDIITVLDDVILNSAVTLKSGTTLLPGDHTVTGTVNSTIILKTGDTVLGYYTELNSALTAANKLSGEVTVEIYDKVEYTADTPALNGKYSSISFPHLSRSALDTLANP